MQWQPDCKIRPVLVRLEAWRGRTIRLHRTENFRNASPPAFGQIENPLNTACARHIVEMDPQTRQKPESTQSDRPARSGLTEAFASPGTSGVQESDDEAIVMVKYAKLRD